MTAGRWTLPPGLSFDFHRRTGRFETSTDNVHAHDFSGLPSAFCMNRRLIPTRKNYLLGLAQPSVKVADIVVIFFGSAVPFVLRKSQRMGASFTHSDLRCSVMGCARSKNLGYCIGPDLRTVVGRVFIRDAMWYQGNIEGILLMVRWCWRSFFWSNTGIVLT